MANIGRPPCNEGVVRASRASAPCTPASAPWVLAATIIGSAMAFIDGTITNVALPQIQERLGATAVDAQWIVEAYTLFLAALILVGGSLGDHYGHRRILLLGVGIFTVASVACALALTPGQLIAARAVQGVGGALLVPGSLAIIGASFREENRGKAIGTWSGFSGITTAIGPVLGGYLVDNVSWRAAFLLNVPLAISVIFIALRHVPESRDQPLQRPLRWRRRWDRGTLRRLPAPLEGVAASATQDPARTAQRGRDRRRGYAPHRARPGPRRVAPGGLR